MSSQCSGHSIGGHALCFAPRGGRHGQAIVEIALIQDGEEKNTSVEPAGFVQYTEVGGGIVHAIKNVGDSEHREILVELKGPSRAATPQEPESNESTVSH
jgi:hypothetical protein